MGAGGTLDQTQFAFYNDGTETGATIIGSIGSTADLEVDTTYHVRIRIEETADTATESKNDELQFSYNSGLWTNITTGTSPVKAVDASGLTHDTDTTKRLAGSRTYMDTNGWVTEDGTLVTLDITASYEVETLMPFQIIGTAVSDNDTVDFRVNGMDAYTLTAATSTVNKPAAGGRRRSNTT